MNREAHNPIPVILTIDVEPDEFLVDRNNPGPWSGFEFCQAYLETLRQEFRQATGRPVHLNWMLRMDPQIATAYGTATWAVDRYGDFFDACLTQGDAIGLHVHNYRWSDSLNNWIDDSANSEWMTCCLETAVDAFRGAFGSPATVLRFGNYWQSTDSVNAAERLSIRYDLSIEPGVLSTVGIDGRPHTAPTPSFTRVPRVPYVPSPEDFRRPGGDPASRQITLIPLTSAYLKLGYRPQELRTRLGRLLRNGIQGRWQSTPLAMLARWEGENRFDAILQRAVARQQNPYLAFVIRSNINRNRLARIDPSMRALLNFCSQETLVFCTPGEAMEQLRQNNSRTTPPAVQ